MGDPDAGATATALGASELSEDFEFEGGACSEACKKAKTPTRTAFMAKRRIPAPTGRGECAIGGSTGSRRGKRRRG